VNDIERTREVQVMPSEGDDGLFTQSWFPICTSEELPVGSIFGQQFLGGRVVAFRGADGTARVMSAYCAHVGGDLSVGTVVGNSVVCRFHRWQYDSDGRVERTGAGDPPPSKACLFRFPTAERYGMVWAFNGKQALWELPALPYPEEGLLCSVRQPFGYDGDPWWFAANTFDFNHIEQLHGLSLGGKFPDEEIEWTQYHARYKLGMERWGDKDASWEFGTYGSNIFKGWGIFEGRWYAEIAGRSLPRPGRSEVYMSILTRRLENESEEQHRAFHARILQNELDLVAEDKPVLQTLRFQQGYLTKSDKALGKFLDYIRAYPRANPAQDFIR
jgi:phenylpropionate dioxygenase-like ring-hydroxylating dioxygenase large terminal subunit